MFNVVWFVAGVLLGVGGTLAILWLYDWMRKTSNRIQRLRHELDHYRRYEEDWIEFQFTKKNKSN
jgi:hypothetical protein